MAEQEGTTALAPIQSGADYSIVISEFDPAGAKSTLTVPLPRDERWGGLLLRAALLKKGGNWKQYDIPTILYAIIYAEHLHLDIEAGDVYMAAEGRMSTTAGAKVKHALASGRIKGMKVETVEGDPVSIPWKTANASGEWKGPNYRTTVTLKVEGWDEPFIYTATLREWFTGANPNWRSRPVYMLEQNALGKACERVVPMGTEADEAPTAGLGPDRGYMAYRWGSGGGPR
jgi:hypothetical protein